MAVELNGDPPDNMSEYWKTVPRENIMDHRYKKIQCSNEILYLDPLALSHGHNPITFTKNDIFLIRSSEKRDA